MTFTEKIEKLLASNHIKEVIDEFLKFLNEVPQSQSDAKSDAGELRGQIIVLSGRFTDLNSKINTNTVNPESANQERAAIIKSFIQILNQLSSSYPDLNTYLEEKNEDDDWNDAQQKNTIDAYHVYFNKYPNGKYKADTIKLIGELEEVKQKQDSEIKRLALLEKERRENDKLSGEAQKQQTNPSGYSAVSSDSSSPAKSKKGLFIGLGIAALAVIIIIVMLVNKKSSATSEETDNNAAPVENTEPADAVKAELKLAYKSAIVTVGKAKFSVDKNVLTASFTGEALKSLSQVIDDEISENYFVETTYEEPDYRSFKINKDGNEAEVLVLQPQSAVIYDGSTKSCKKKIPLFKQSETVYFNYTENGWIIISFVDGKEPVPDPVACESAN